MWDNYYVNFFEKYKFEINVALIALFEKHGRKTELNPILNEAMQYAVVLGGKRIRPILGILSFEILQNQKTKITRAKAIRVLLSLELFHAFSLVHDDLPAIDNDQLRRGQLSVWKKFGEANAILTGDALTMLAFENLAENAPDFTIRSLTKILAECAGACGMIGGQVRDLQTEKNLSLEALLKTHRQKTGMLILAAVKMGAVLACADFQKTKLLESYAKKIGLAFQIKDDLLDVYGDEKILGKKVGKDYTKKGFIKLLGLKNSEEKLEKLITEAIVIARTLKSRRLGWLAGFVLSREK